VVTIKAADPERGEVKASRFTCEGCGRALDEPVEKTSLYVMRDGQPVLVHPACLKEGDLYIWGPLEYLDRRDWTKEEKKAEEDKKKAAEEAAAAQADMDRLMKEEEERRKTAMEVKDREG
jgi:hypothetical protein